jgi:hypothetical protein
MEFNIQEVYTQNSQAISVWLKLHKTDNFTLVHCIFLSMYYDEKCFIQKLQKEIKAQSHPNRSAIDRSFMTHGERFTTRSVPNEVINKNLFSFCSQWKGRNKCSKPIVTAKILLY